ncbi:MAG: tRNA preQ1(34) S-adenosylmethionine ribosyltransferase-isomerase QueA [Thermodesulfovibrionales bacterium]|nr:tRNA preQ1(34) S-adenosylmethionine ribosyltransferase-isomerase QueA [Thermodesulfovibrionales bacterium]MDP3112677.1 tRNA preQ1(34) S-adenosylmethionine ribosyltransferase-isomerase QueA [Thermodesulfovibrionales bacterium]
MKAADFDFSLPDSLVAKKPAEKRDGSNLLVLHRDGKTEHRKFSNLPEYLYEGDMLLLNNTRVFPAKLTGIKPTGGKIEFLLVKETGTDTWEILSRKQYNGRLAIAAGFSAEIDGRTACFSYSGDFMDNLWRYGDMPLPPYIKRRPEQIDKERYQTIYAEQQGSIAAPTAGLHFTGELMDRIKAKGVNVRYLTLHVGIGTFKMIKTENIEEHSMDSEYFEIDADIVDEIKKTKASNKRVISVGTTTTRAIEGYFSNQLSVVSCQRNGTIRGYTNIFIYPGYKFKAVDSLVTNFHLPRSTPLMLTSAFGGLEKLKEAYNTAIGHKYRFFSYGDAMLIL